MTETGVVVFYDQQNRYGFIAPDDESGDLVFSLVPGEGPVQVGDNVIFERMPTPYITPIGPTAYHVRRAGFTPAEPDVALDAEREPEMEVRTTI